MATGGAFDFHKQKKMFKPVIKICTTLPEIGIPNDPIVLYNGSKLLVSYEISPSNGRYAVIQHDYIVEYKVTSINDEGIGKHKYAKYGLQLYSIHEIENIEELANNSPFLNRKYWVYCFKERTFEILGSGMNVVEANCDAVKLKNLMTEFLQ